jgi:hypothetical protein
MVSAKASDPERATSAVDVIVPASFNFPSAGKLLSLGFVALSAGVVLLWACVCSTAAS